MTEITPEQHLGFRKSYLAELVKKLVINGKMLETDRNKFIYKFKDEKDIQIIESYIFTAKDTLKNYNIPI